MENKTFRGSVQDIFKRLDYMAAMASLNDSDIESILIEKRQLEQEIKSLNSDIKACTPSTADLAAARNNDQVRLSTKQIELTELKDQLKIIEEDLEENKKEFLELETNENSINNTIESNSKQVETFEQYKVNSREFKNFVADNKNDIDSLKDELAKIKVDKKRVSNSISLLSDDREELVNKIDNLQEEISVIEYNLSSNKNYKESASIQNKRRMREPFIKERDEKQATLDSLLHSPVYLVHSIKENIAAKKDYDETLDLVNELYDKVLEQPYMSKTIRNANVSALESEYNDLKKKEDSLKKKISKSDYTIQKLPMEEVRTSFIEKLINLKNSQIKHHEDIIDSNKVAIKEIAGEIKTLNSSFRERTNDVNEYASLINTVEEGREKAKKKRQLDIQRNVIDTEKNIIDRLKTNIIELINQNNQEETSIDQLRTDIKSLTKESSEILNTQLKRNNYKDVIKESKDQEELESIETQIAYLSKRLEYQNYNPTQLKNEITTAMKKLYNKKKEVKKEEKVEVKPVVKKKTAKKAKVKPIKSEKITTFDELVKESTKTIADDATKEIKESVDSFEKVADLLPVFNDTQDNVETKDIDNSIDIDFDKIMNTEQKKHEENNIEVTIKEKIEAPKEENVVKVEEPVKEESNEIVANPLNEKLEDILIDEEPKAEVKSEKVPAKGEKLKVISVENKNMEVAETKTEVENPKLKVVSVEPKEAIEQAEVKQETKEEKKDSIDLTTQNVFDLYNPFMDNVDSSYSQNILAR